jgi:hypothetical protein
MQAILDEYPAVVNIDFEWTWQDKLQAFAENALPIVEKIDEVVKNAQRGVSDATSA